MHLRSLMAMVLAAAVPIAAAAQGLQWNDVVAKAKGQTVNFNAWGGVMRNLPRALSEQDARIILGAVEKLRTGLS